MRIGTKIWLGIGTAVVAASGEVSAAALIDSGTRAPAVVNSSSDSVNRAVQVPMIVAQRKGGGEHGEHGEGGEGEGGGKAAKLPPDLDFALRIAQIRGHLTVADELVKQGDWNAALPHFRHPMEELYGAIRPKLKTYNVAAFDSALKALAAVAKSKKAGEPYDKALAAVDQALTQAETRVAEKQTDKTDFTLDTAFELLKSAGHEYEEAVKKGRITNAVEYQDGRGFVWFAEKTFERLAPELEKKDSDAVSKVRDGLAELKKAWPSAKAPKAAAKDHAAVLGDLARIELALGKLH
jgi:hypothetical protein